LQNRKKYVLFINRKHFYGLIFIIMKNTKKVIAYEKINMMLVDNKINEYIKKFGHTADEDKCRLVKLTLRHDVLHCPVNIPFIVAIKRCKDEKNVVYNIARSKMAVINLDDISSATPVIGDFSIRGIRYEAFDQICGYTRFRPRFKRNDRCQADSPNENE